MQIVSQHLSALTDSYSRGYRISMKLISSSEAAAKLGVHITRVQVLIREGRLPAQLIGGSYVIDEADLRLVNHRKPGRPSLLVVSKAEKAEKAEKAKRTRCASRHSIVRGVKRTRVRTTD